MKPEGYHPHLSRRQFLQIAIFGLPAAALGLTACSKDNPLITPAELVPIKDKDSSVYLALRMAQAAEELGPFAPPNPKTIEEARQLAEEIAPYYEFNGMVTSPADVKSITIKKYDEDDNFYLLGSSYCRNSRNDITLNARYFNRWSSWYGKAELVASLAHELAHTYARMCGYDDLVEAAAQLGSMEVLAAMARDSNKIAMLPFLIDVKELAEDYFLKKCLDEGTMDEYRERYIAKLPNATYELSWYDKQLKIWQKDNFYTLSRYLKKYGSNVYEMLCDAAVDPDHLTIELPSVKNYKNKIDMSDTLWVLSHFSAMVEGYKLLYTGVTKTIS